MRRWFRRRKNARRAPLTHRGHRDFTRLPERIPPDQLRAGEEVAPRDPAGGAGLANQWAGQFCAGPDDLL